MRAMPESRGDKTDQSAFTKARERVPVAAPLSAICMKAGKIQR